MAVLIVFAIVPALRRLVGLLLRLLANLSTEQLDSAQVSTTLHFVVPKLGSLEDEVSSFPTTEVLTPLGEVAFFVSFGSRR